MEMVIVIMKIAFLSSIDGSVQDSSNSSALAKELQQFCPEPSIWHIFDAYLFLPHICIIYMDITVLFMYNLPTCFTNRDYQNNHWISTTDIY